MHALALSIPDNEKKAVLKPRKLSLLYYSGLFMPGPSNCTSVSLIQLMVVGVNVVHDLPVVDLTAEQMSMQHVQWCNLFFIFPVIWEVIDV